MYDTSDIRKGLKFVIDGVPFSVVDFQFVKPGKGQAFTRTKIRNMITGAVIDKTYKSGEKLMPADIEEKEMNFLYKEGEHYVFMDTTSYEQLHINAEQMEDHKGFLVDNMLVQVLLFQGRPIGVTPPTFVELQVTSTEPGFKGDTSSNTQKPAIVQTGMQVSVPLFVNEGDWLKIDTRTGQYVERVKK